MCQCAALKQETICWLNMFGRVVTKFRLLFPTFHHGPCSLILFRLGFGGLFSLPCAQSQSFVRRAENKTPVLRKEIKTKSKHTNQNPQNANKAPATPPPPPETQPNPNHKQNPNLNLKPIYLVRTICKFLMQKLQVLTWTVQSRALSLCFLLMDRCTRWAPEAIRGAFCMIPVTLQSTWERGRG